MTTATPTPTQQFADIARRGQEATTGAVESWTRALRGYADTVTSEGPRPVDLQVATSAAFDLAERILTTQREFATTTLALLTEAAESASAQVSQAGETLKARTDEATERVIDLASETTRRAANATRNGVSV
jgi:hypothetical protein